MIKAITIYSLQIPFRFSYGHSKKQHKFVSTILVTVEGDSGEIGVGEAVPREYVTGETPESVYKQAAALAAHFVGSPVNSKQDIDDKLSSLSLTYENAFPSCAFCCLDIALHDFVAKKNKMSMAQYLGSEPKSIEYTASIGLKNKSKLISALLLYRALGFKSLKLKVGDEHDEQRLKMIRHIMGGEAKIHADANGAWNFRQSISKIDLLSKYNVWAVEEPLIIPMPKDVSSAQFNRESQLNELHFENYAKLRSESALPVILDESCISARSVQNAIEFNAMDYINIRLSKLGGYSLTQKIIRAVPHNKKYGIGAMVGETAILASAGYFFGCKFSDALFMQGFSHKLLHKGSVARENIKFRGPLAQISNPAKYGLGLDIDVKSLSKFILKKNVVKHG